MLLSFRSDKGEKSDSSNKTDSSPTKVGFGMTNIKTLNILFENSGNLCLNLQYKFYN